MSPYGTCAELVQSLLPPGDVLDETAPMYQDHVYIGACETCTERFPCILATSIRNGKRVPVVAMIDTGSLYLGTWRGYPTDWDSLPEAWESCTESAYRSDGCEDPKCPVHRGRSLEVELNSV